jgi:hypothetical protein
VREEERACVCACRRLLTCVVVTRRKEKEEPGELNRILPYLKDILIPRVREG